MSDLRSRELSGISLSVAELADIVVVSLADPDPHLSEIVRLHLEALDSALLFEAPELLADQRRWQTVRLAAHGFPMGADDVDAAVRRALLTLVSDRRFGEIERLCVLASRLQGWQPITPDPVVDQAMEEYFDAALHGDRERALGVVRRRMLDGLSADDVMLTVLEPAQYQLGSRWEAGEISVAHEHVVTAITHDALALLYRHGERARSLSVVAATVATEAHEIGVRMICDLLSGLGWSASYLGSGVPDADVVEIVAERRADVVALSASMAGHLRDLQRLVSRLRSDPRTKDVWVLVGGRPFLLNLDLVERVGADAWAPEGGSAVTLCERWAAAQGR